MKNALQLALLGFLACGCHAACDARSMIAQHEGKRDCVYVDTMGHPTIGIGYNLDNPGARQAISAVGADYDSIRSGKTCLSDSQVMKLFEPSYQSAVSGARRAVSSYDSLCCSVQNVMTDMDYNLGDGGFASFSGFIGYINNKQWSQAAADGKGTAWCSQVGSRCSDDMAAVARGCGGPSPPSPPSPPSSSCKDCVKNGGGEGCISRCQHCGSSCTSCIKGAGGKACADRCCGSVLSDREQSFMNKWGDLVSVRSLADLVEPLDNRTASRALLQAPPAPGANPFAMLNQIIQAITGDWSSIVNAFKSSYSEQLDYEQLARGWSKFKEATKVFKGEGLTYDKAPAFFADIRNMIQIPANYSKDFDQIVQFIQFFDKEYWSEHDTTFNIGEGGTSSHFTMMANNNQDTSKIDVMFLTLSESFALAPDVFIITESHSYLGGIWSTQKIKFEQKPAAITSEELQFVSQYFLLLAYQEIALAENLPAPPNPNFGPSPPPPSRN